MLKALATSLSLVSTGLPFSSRFARSSASTSVGFLLSIIESKARQTQSQSSFVIPDLFQQLLCADTPQLAVVTSHPVVATPVVFDLRQGEGCALPPSVVVVWRDSPDSTPVGNDVCRESGDRSRVGRWVGGALEFVWVELRITQGGVWHDAEATPRHSQSGVPLPVDPSADQLAIGVVRENKVVIGQIVSRQSVDLCFL